LSRPRLPGRASPRTLTSTAPCCSGRSWGSGSSALCDVRAGVRRLGCAACEACRTGGRCHDRDRARAGERSVGLAGANQTRGRARSCAVACSRSLEVPRVICEGESFPHLAEAIEGAARLAAHAVVATDRMATVVTPGRIELPASSRSWPSTTACRSGCVPAGALSARASSGGGEVHHRSCGAPRGLEPWTGTGDLDRWAITVSDGATRTGRSPIWPPRSPARVAAVASGGA